MVIRDVKNEEAGANELFAVARVTLSDLSSQLNICSKNTCLCLKVILEKAQVITSDRSTPLTSFREGRHVSISTYSLIVFTSNFKCCNLNKSI